jgi:hypothetical protein
MNSRKPIWKNVVCAVGLLALTPTPAKGDLMLLGDAAGNRWLTSPDGLADPLQIYEITCLSGKLRAANWFSFEQQGLLRGTGRRYRNTTRKDVRCFHVFSRCRSRRA